MIYDITQPLFECEVFPGDPKPVKTSVRRMENGDAYNMTAISMCVHNGTHIDAPFHFLKDGKGVNEIPLEKLIGAAYVVSHEGEVTARDAESILERAAREHRGAEKKLLIKGRAVVTLEAAQIFAQAGIDLLGNESQTVGPENAPMAVHLALLEKEVVLLEGIRLSAVADGAYFLNAAPLNLTDTDGAPCRAVLMDFTHLH
ncbi:MAG: cyclase family protein [Oscillospiraceae bacterium]